jgi:DNA-binding CsgD family transcriptional regulator
MDALSRAALAFFNQAGAAKRLADLIDRFAPVARAGGFTSAACHHIARPGHPISPRLLFGWNLADQDQRMLEETMSRTDAAVSSLFLSTTPIALDDLARVTEVDPRAPTLTRSRGLVVPVHGPLGEITCVALLGGREALDPQSRRTLQTAAALLASRGGALAEVEADASPTSRPSRREAQCAHLALAGMNDWEIGRVLGVTEDAVALHFDRLKAKFGVSHRSEIPPRDWRNIAQLDD